MNFSHGSYEYHQSVIDNTRAAVKANPTGRPLAIALDTKGPEIRTGLMTNDTDVKIEAGHEFWVTTNPEYAEKGSAEYMYVDYVSTPSSFPDLMGWRL
jgi:pyruvate kinase